MPAPLRVVIIKPSKYTADGYVERFRWGFMPNSTVPYVRSMIPASIEGVPIEVAPHRVVAGRSSALSETRNPQQH